MKTLFTILFVISSFIVKAQLVYSAEGANPNNYTITIVYNSKIENNSYLIYNSNLYEPVIYNRVRDTTVNGVDIMAIRSNKKEPLVFVTIAPDASYIQTYNLNGKLIAKYVTDNLSVQPKQKSSINIDGSMLMSIFTKLAMFIL